MLGVGPTMPQGRPRFDRDNHDVVSPFNHPRCQIFKDVSAIVPQFFSHMMSFVGQFFKDVSTIIHSKILCQLGQHCLQPFSELKVQPMPYVLLSHKVGKVFGGVWHSVQLPDHYCCL